MNTQLIKLKEQRDELTNQIAELEKQELEKSISFIEKLKVWKHLESGINLRTLPNKRVYPALSECIDDWDEFDRHEVCVLCEHYADEINTIIEEGENTQSVDPFIVDGLKEAIEKNIYSIKIDW